MKIKCLLVGVAVCVTYSQVCLAEGLPQLSYTFVQVSYGEADFDDTDIGADSIGIGASFDVGSNVFVDAGYSSAESDDFTVFGATGSVKTSGFDIGLGYHHSLNPTVDLVSSFSLIDATTEFQGEFSGIPDEDDTGYAIGVGLRTLISPQVELSGGFSYVDVFDDDNTSFSLGGFYYPVEKLGIGIGYRVSDDTKSFRVTGRVNF